MKNKILVADDQAGIRLLLTDIFTSLGYEVATAMTGKEAMDTIQENVYDLIMLDYWLPIFDGGEVLQKMKQEKITTPVILMSGFTESIKDISEKSSMLVEVVAKPFNIKEVSSLVQSMIASA